MKIEKLCQAVLTLTFASALWSRRRLWRIGSNRGMTIDSSRAESASAAQACGLSVPDTDTRLTELEIKASYADDLLDHLNEVVARQQQQIDLLVREVARLNRQLGENAAASGGAGARDPRDEIPPHW